jgi:hypothetical protein
MWIDDEVVAAHEAARLEREVARSEGERVLSRLTAARVEAAKLGQLVARRDELARRLVSVTDEAAARRHETKARTEFLREGGERTQRYLVSVVRLAFRLVLAVSSFRLLAEVGTPAALGLALLPIGAMWLVWLWEVRR